MLTPPFKRSGTGGLAVLANPRLEPCCEHHEAAASGSSPAHARSRLHQLDPHLHCSLIGTCLGTGELRKLMARHVDVRGQSDLEVHHLAVGLAVQGGDVLKALHKALDQRHAGAVRTFSAATDEAALDAAWKQAWAAGDIPGAYWALLTHKTVTPELRQEAFGEVHMLSHLMGSAHRHELQRFVALEKENAELHERLEREQLRRQEAIQERDDMAARMQQQSIDAERRIAQAVANSQQAAAPRMDGDWIALQTQRREQAERQAEETRQQCERLQEQLDRLQSQGRALVEELAAAEEELHRLSTAAPTSAGSDHGWLRDRRVLYVGGRPSSTPAIRDYVERRGGEFLHHDGGLESRKGLLAALLPRAHVVVFPVDCVDHDSVSNLKRLSERHQVPFVALRSASLASFAATLQRELTSANAEAQQPFKFCLRHG